MLVHIWPGNNLSFGMAQTDKIIGWCPEEFRVKLSPTIGLIRQYSEMVAIAFSLMSQKCCLGKRSSIKLYKEVQGNLEDSS